MYTISRVLSFAVFCCVLSGCSQEEAQTGNSLTFLYYPNANSVSELNQTARGSGENRQQFQTTDRYDRVVSFYRSRLADYPINTRSSRSDDGRQITLSVRTDKGLLTISIQEFMNDGHVMITLLLSQPQAA